MFFIWFSVNFNILAFSTGSSGPVFFSLGIKDSLLVILVVDIMCVTQKFFWAILLVTVCYLHMNHVFALISNLGFRLVEVSLSRSVLPQLVLMLTFTSLLEHVPFQLICAFPTITQTGCRSKNASFSTYLSEIYFLSFPLGSLFSAVFGPKLGMRAMVQCRFSWGYVQTIFHILICLQSPNSDFLSFCIGFKITDIYRYYAASLPSILNVFSSQSFLILNAIIGGQALAAVSNKLDDTLGIVIIGLVSFIVGF